MMMMPYYGQGKLLYNTMHARIEYLFCLYLTLKFSVMTEYFSVCLCVTQGADAVVPVYLRGGRRDVLIYRSLMVLSVVGAVFTFQQLYLAAAGKMKKL